MIVRAEFIENVESSVSFDEMKIPLNWYTISKMKVLEVYKDDKMVYQPGDTLRVIQPYGKWRDLRGAYEIYTEDYTPLISGKEFILYLGWWEDYEAYQINGDYHGKFIVSSPVQQKLSNVNLNQMNVQLDKQLTSDLQIENADPVYIENWQQVMNKYNNEEK